MALAEFTVFVRAVKRATARAFGIDASARADVLGPMLEKPYEDRPLYWFELTMAMGIATFGLVLDSAGIVIGAMLIAPLMTPILELAMGLVVLSSYLLIRALTRVAASVLVVLAGAALITLVLPFNEPTRELLARTSPTALDLFVAIFCALVAAMTSTRPRAGATSTAAGTAIGISLVPPLCASGFGFGSGDMRIAEGALLLFVANFCAILMFASLFYWLVGFERVAQGGAAARTALGPLDAWKLAVARVLERRLGGPYGGYVRLLIPAALLAVVFVPLQRALSEVSWQVQTRSAIAQQVDAEPMLADALQVTSSVERGAVGLSAVVVGTDDQALALERRLTVALAAASGSAPLVRIRAVPQASLFARPTQAPAREAVADPITLVSPAQAAAKVADDVLGALRRRWPGHLGPIVDARVELVAGQPMLVAFAYLGAASGAATDAVLAESLSQEVGTRVGVRSEHLMSDPGPTALRQGEQWWTERAALVRRALTLPDVAVCLDLPSDAGVRRDPAGRRARARVLADVAGADPARLAVVERDGWRVRFVTGPCASPAGTDADRSASAAPIGQGPQAPGALAVPPARPVVPPAGPVVR